RRSRDSTCDPVAVTPVAAESSRTRKEVRGGPMGALRGGARSCVHGLLVLPTARAPATPRRDRGGPKGGGGRLKPVGGGRGEVREARLGQHSRPRELSARPQQRRASQGGGCDRRAGRSDPTATPRSGDEGALVPDRLGSRLGAHDRRCGGHGGAALGRRSAPVEDGTGSREKTLNLTLFGRQSLPACPAQAVGAETHVPVA